MTSDEKKKFLDLIQKYFEGGNVSPKKEKKSSGPVYPKGQFKDQDFSDEGLRKYFGAKPPNFDVGGRVALNNQVQEPQQKAFQAKEYFGKGSNGPGEGVANSMGVAMTMADGGWTDLANKIREAFKDPPLSKEQIQNKETPEERNERIRKENSERNTGKRPSLESEDPEYNSQTQYKFDGGDVANTASSLAPLLKATYAGSSKKKKTEKMATGGWAPEQVPKDPHPLHMPGFHAPTEKKYPINIPRAPKLTIPKRLKSISDVKGYADGTGPDGVQDDDSQNLNPDDFTQPGESIPSKAGLADFIKYNLAHRDPGQTAREMGMAASMGGIGGIEGKLPSRALTTEEMEAVEDLFRADPSMKSQELREQADLYGKQGDIPEDIRNQLPQSNFPATTSSKTSELPIPSQERGLTTIPEKGLTVRGERGLIEGEPPTELPGSSGERNVEEISEPEIPRMSNIKKAGILGAAGLVADKMANKEDPDKVIVKDIQRKIASKPISKQKDLVKKIKNQLSIPFQKNQDFQPAKEINVTGDADTENVEVPYFGEEFKAGEEADKNPEKYTPTTIQGPEEGKKEESQPYTEQQKQPGLFQRLKDAQDRRNKTDLISGLGAIAERGAAAYAGIPTTQQQSYKENMAMAEQSVQDVKDQIAMEDKDPNSATSQMFRQYLETLTGQKVDPNTTAAAAKELFPVAKAHIDDVRSRQELTEKLKERLQQANLASETKKETTKQHNDLMMALGLQKSEQAKQKAEEKFSADQDKQLAQTTQLLEQMRGSPAVSQAEKDLYSAEKAQSLMNIYKDPNKLSQRQVALLGSEVAKIAQGGVATMEELKNITPNTLLGGKLASFTENLINKPSPANAAAFIKQFNDYLQPLKKDAQKVIEDRYGRIIESKKKLLGNDNYDTLKQNYISRFNNIEQQSSKQDPKIQQYAQQYNMDYDKAAKLLKARGYNP